MSLPNLRQSINAWRKIWALIELTSLFRKAPSIALLSTLYLVLKIFVASWFIPIRLSFKASEYAKKVAARARERRKENILLIKTDPIVKKWIYGMLEYAKRTN